VEFLQANYLAGIVTGCSSQIFDQYFLKNYIFKTFLVTLSKVSLFHISVIYAQVGTVWLKCT